MNYLDKEHDKPITRIEQWKEDGKSWDEIKTLSFYDNTEYSKFETRMDLAKLVDSFPKSYTEEQWGELVQFIKEKQEPKLKTVTKLAAHTKNDAKISKQSKSAWQLYRKKLENKQWSDESVDYIEESAYEILQMLNQDTKDTTPVKGLVLGNVQSGKTANMAGLIAMAADYGFNYFIILSGMIENLRKQTENRLYDDLNSPGNLNWQIIQNPHPNISESPADYMQNLDLRGSSDKRYMSVVLKNSSRMKSLVKYLYSIPDKANQLKILVIDDEADQASINTKKMEDTIKIEEEIERTAINKEIVNLVHGYQKIKIKAVNYISYTATPYANILNESSEKSLYPQDFIISLEPASNYIGPRQLFRLTEPETHASLDVIREIPDQDIKLLSEIHKGEFFKIPKSLIEAIQWFLITTVALKINGHKKPISMLIHTSQKIDNHQELEYIISRYLWHIKKVDSTSFLKQCENLYLKEIHDFTKIDFSKGMPDYSIPFEEIADYPEWKQIKEGLRALLVREKEEYLSHIKLDEDGKTTYHRGIHLCIDNSRTSGNSDEFVRLVYPNKRTDPGFSSIFIVIGGNTLSRGLTLEGLTTSYFMRNTLASDTLMQMGRWFGFREGYEIFPRIWINSLVKERFEFVTQLDQELREEILDFKKLGKSPKEFGVRVKNSPSNAFIRITSANKMQGAFHTDLDFTGTQMQTIIFEDDTEMLTHNIKITEDLLNSLDEPELNGSRLVWTDVSFSILKDLFFSKYRASQNDIRFSNLDAFIKWCSSVDHKKVLDNWSVVLSSKGGIKNKSNTDSWNIKDYAIQSVQRTVLGSRHNNGKVVSIGALRSPLDLLTDIIKLPKEEIVGTLKMSEVREIRREYGKGNTPQLVIYRIDKNSTPDNTNIKKQTESSNKRSPLNFSQDIIGISIMIPGLQSNINLAEKLVINLPNSFQE